MGVSNVCTFMVWARQLTKRNGPQSGITLNLAGLQERPDVWFEFVGWAEGHDEDADKLEPAQCR